MHYKLKPNRVSQASVKNTKRHVLRMAFLSTSAFEGNEVRRFTREIQLEKRAQRAGQLVEAKGFSNI